MIYVPATSYPQHLRGELLSLVLPLSLHHFHPLLCFAEDRLTSMALDLYKVKQKVIFYTTTDTISIVI